MDYSIRLSFLTNDGKALNISVPKANPDVTGADVRAAMERILNTGIITAAAGEPSTADKAELISTDELVYNL